MTLLLRIGLGFLLTVTGACSAPELQTPSIPLAIVLPSAHTLERTRAEHRAGESALHALSERIPGFAGIGFVKPSEVLVRIAGRYDAAHTQEIVRTFLTQSRLTRDLAVLIRIEAATYSFLKLAEWRDAIADILYSMDGWRSLDLDELRNRIVIGMASPSHFEDARRILRAFAIPDDAYLIIEDHGIVLNATLESRLRPLRGGIQIAPGECTLGVIALWGADTVALVNSHCSARHWGLDDPFAWLRQPSDGPFWGIEMWDTPGYVCGPMNMDRCRRADVAVFPIDVDVALGESRVAFGQLARPTSRRPGSDGATGGGWVIDEGNPLLITGTLDAIIQGQTLDKIGWKTGWTFGQVTQTCYNSHIEDLPFPNGHRVFVCQGVAAYNSDRGDSGAPVFLNNGTSAVLAGLNHSSKGGDPTGTLAVFSPVSQLRSELFH